MMKRFLFFFVFLLSSVALDAHAGMMAGRVTFKLAINGLHDAKKVRLWIPYPVTDRFQKIQDIRISGNFERDGVYRDPENGNLALYAEWSKKTCERRLRFQFKVFTKERKVGALREDTDYIPVEVKKFLAETARIPTHGRVKQIAEEISRGKRSILKRARAIYDWTVKNTYRDPKVKGCGLGLVERMLQDGGGKCVDISSVFVALARAAGVPAREVFGLRLGQKKDQDITGWYHCWAEFYLPGTGWIPVDPADVRKVMLVRNLDLEEAGAYREYFFGAVDQYRIVLGRAARGVRLEPPQASAPLNYFMYPYAEVEGRPLDFQEPKGFSYQILFKKSHCRPSPGAGSSHHKRNQ